MTHKTIVDYAEYVLTRISTAEWVGFCIVAFLILLSNRWYRVVFRKNRDDQEHHISLENRLSWIYVAFILLVTLFVREIGAGGRLAWVPLWSWREVIFHHNLQLFWQILLNILLFMPLGVLLALDKGRSLRKILGLGAVLSLTIELSQLIFKLGLFEWDDILHNALGCVLGGALIKGSRKLKDFFLSRAVGKSR